MSAGGQVCPIYARTKFAPYTRAQSLPQNKKPHAQLRKKEHHKMAKALSVISEALAATPPSWARALSTARETRIFLSPYDDKKAGTQDAAQGLECSRQAEILLAFLKTAFSQNLPNAEFRYLVDHQLVRWAFKEHWPKLGSKEAQERWPHLTLSRAFCSRLIWFLEEAESFPIEVERQLSWDGELFHGALCQLEDDFLQPLDVLDAYQAGDSPAFVWAWLVQLLSFEYPIGNPELLEEIGLSPALSLREKFETIVRRFVAAVWRVHNASAYDPAAAWASLLGKFELPKPAHIVNAMLAFVETRGGNLRASAFLEGLVEQLRCLVDRDNEALQERASNTAVGLRSIRVPTYEPSPSDYVRKRLCRGWLATYFAQALRCSAPLLHALHCNNAFETLWT